MLSAFLTVSSCLSALAQYAPPPLVACQSTCTGNLGENIFPDGDFGQGAANVLLGNPGLAPGYSYVTNPPPNDGSYTITNNTTNWGWFAAASWINIQDNGPEPDGYMMVVNASYQPGLFYEKTVAVCENTLYEFSIDVINIHEAGSGSSILPNVAFQIDGNTVCETGTITFNKTWQTYRFSFTTMPGQTQAALSLRNNAPGGIGNDLAIDNISFRACGPEIGLPPVSPFCENKPLLLNASLTNSPYTSTFYQWQVKPAGTSVWTDLPGAVSLSFEVDNPVAGNEYRLVAANSAGNLSLPNCRAVSTPLRAELEDLSDFAIAGEDTIVCNGAPATLEAGNFAQFQWSTGDNSATLLAGAPGWYSVSVTSVNGCTASDSLYVFEVNLSASAGWTDPLCFGDSSGTVEAGGIQGGVGPVRYALDGGPFQNTPRIDRIAAGQHVLTVSDSLQCRLEIPFVLTDPPRLEVSLDGDRSIYVCDSLLLGSSTNMPVVSYQWQPEAGLQCPDCPATLAMPMNTTTYLLRVSDAIGCTAVDSMTLTVLPRLDVYAPNVFVPDLSSNDENNYFTIFTSKSATLVRRLMIYDRWGSLVFSRQNRAPGDRDLRWDGSDSGGKTFDAGVFVWVAEVEFTDGQSRVFSGDVMLWRQ